MSQEQTLEQALSAIEGLMAGAELDSDGAWGRIVMPSGKAMDAGKAAADAMRAALSATQPAQAAQGEQEAELRRSLAAAEATISERNAEIISLHKRLKAAQGAGEAVASIYITPDGSREMDDWKHDLPVGQNILYTQPAAGADVLKNAARYEWLRHPDTDLDKLADDNWGLGGEVYSGEKLDAAIDAAIAASGRQE